MIKTIFGVLVSPAVVFASVIIIAQFLATIFYVISKDFGRSIFWFAAAMKYSSNFYNKVKKGEK